MRHCVVVWVVAGLVVLHWGCTCAGDGVLVANGDAGPKDDHQLSCACLINLRSGRLNQFDVEICLPPSLNHSLDPAVNSLSDAEHADKDAADRSSGNTASDVRFGSAAFCIRSERDGKVKDARQVDGHGRGE